MNEFVVVQVLLLAYLCCISLLKILYIISKIINI